jgi:hypothetical protein
MKPLSNKVTIPILIAAVELLCYFLFDLAVIAGGIAIISGPVYPLYLSIGFSILLVLGLVFSIKARIEWESKKVNAGRF